MYVVRKKEHDKFIEGLVKFSILRPYKGGKYLNKENRQLSKDLLKIWKLKCP